MTTSRAKKHNFDETSSSTAQAIHAGAKPSVEGYVEWVRSLRQSFQAAGPIAGEPGDPIKRLGDELQLLTEALATRERQLATLADAVGNVAQGLELEDVLARVFDGFRAVIPFDRIGCAFVSDNGRTLEAFWQRSNLGPVQIAAGYRQALEGSSLVKVLETGQPRIIDDLEAYLAAKPQSDATRRIVAEGGRSSLTCPLMVDGVPLGVLFFTSHQARTYTTAHQSTFRSIATQLSALIQRSRAYDVVVRHNRNLLARTQKLHVFATTDGLTGLLNRRAGDALLARASDRLRAVGEPFGVLLCDIDHFKEVNDKCGHAVGDRVLRAVAGRMERQLRPDDRAIRIGGDEFLVIVPRCADARELAVIGERIQQAIANHPVSASIALTVTGSVGGAVASMASINDVVQHADRALYDAKHRGRNRVVLGG